MSIFTLGSPPLRAKVGIEGADCKLLGSDPSGLRGRPYDTTQSMSNIAQFRPFSPNCVLWLVITTYTPLADGSLSSFAAMDAVGQWWFGNFAIDKGALYRGSEPGTDKGNWFENAVKAVAEAIVTYGIPVVAAALAATGVVGLVASGALLAWRNMAMGRPLTTEILNQQQKALALDSPSLLDAFNQGLAKARAGLSDKALQAALSTLPSAITSPETRKVFYEAVTLVRARQVQDLTVASLSKAMAGKGTWGSVNGDDVYRMNMALRWGGSLSAIMTGLEGAAGDRLLLATTQNASNFVAANVEHPEKIAAAIKDPTVTGSVPGLLVTVPSGGGGSSSSSGPGIGTAIVVGGLGYGLYKFWPKIMHSFSRPGQPKRGFR